MRVLIAVAAVALASAANPSITLQIPGDDDNATISWDGESLFIPEHTDKLVEHGNHLAMLDGNVTSIKRTLTHLESKLDALNTTVEGVKSWKQQTAAHLINTTNWVAAVEDDVSENFDAIDANHEKIKNRACKVGKYRTSKGYCTNCDVGQYQNEVGQSSCKECNTGRYQPYKGQTGCTNCVAGAYQNLPGKTKCKSCSDIGKYDNRAGRATCGYTCTTCNSATHWYESRCTATSNAKCRAKWDSQKNGEYCSCRFGSKYTNENAVKSACANDNWCVGVTYMKHVRGGRRRRTSNVNEWRMCCGEYTLGSYANRRRRRRRGASIEARFYDFNARPCEVKTDGTYYCPTWN